MDNELTFKTIINIFKLKTSGDNKNKKLSQTICNNNYIHYDILLEEIDFMIPILNNNELILLKETLIDYINVLQYSSTTERQILLRIEEFIKI